MTTPPTSRPVRRYALRLPSRKPHVALASLALLLGLGLPLLLATSWGDPADALAGGEIALAPAPVPTPPSALDDDTLDTPDLLAGEVAEGENPTEDLITVPALDALGNPVGGRADGIPAPAAPSTARRNLEALPPAPIAGLTRGGPFGPVPARTDTGTAFELYRRRAPALEGKRPVSLVIGGLGINRALTQRAIDELPANVTLSFAAHSRGLQGWVDAARAAGHEVLIEVPMESVGFDAAEPGANRALRVNAPDTGMASNLDYLLSRAQGAFGVTNYNGELFLQRTDKAASLVDYLGQTGLGFMTDGAFETPTLRPLAASVSLPFVAGNGLVDPQPIPEQIQANLVSLARDAKAGNHPVGVGFAYAETIAAARNWADALDAQGLKLVPASAAMR